MEEEERGLRLSKRFSDQGGEVDLKTKAGTAWSHNFLNQKPWHPLSYPNQRRKWIAEQTHAQRQRRSEEVAREFAQEQEFFRQTALVSKKEKEKMEMMKAVSFMYVRPPGYNAESAKAAEIAEETRKQEEGNSQPGPEGTSEAVPLEGLNNKDQSNDGKKKKRPRDVFGRALPTEEQFEVLKNAPKMETGIAGRAKPFGIELRNVKCLRCGNFGHQSGDRECPLKDTITPNEESRLKRDDPLTTMMAHAESSEPLKWELKQRPGMSPPRGGFNQDDPNQQIVAEDIFDEYGGFLGAEIIPDLLANFSSEKPKKKKHKRRSSPTAYKSKDDHDISSEDEDRKNSKKRKHRRKKAKHSTSSESDDAEFGRHVDENDKKKSKERKHKRKKPKHSDSSSSDDSEIEERHEKSKHKKSYDDSTSNAHRKQSKSKSSAYDDSGSHQGHYYDSRSNEYYYRPSETESKRKTSAYHDSRYEQHHQDDLRYRERHKQSKSKTSAYDDMGSEDCRHDDSRSRDRHEQSKSRSSAYDKSRPDEQRRQSKHKTSAYDDSGSDDERRSKHRSCHGHDR